MLLKVTETDTFTMNNSQKNMDYYHSVYPFGNHFDGYSMHQNYFQDFTNGYLDNSNTENHETWPRGSYHSNVYDNTDETASKDCRFKRKGGKIHNDQFIPDHCCQIKEEIDDSHTSCLREQRGQLELGQSPALYECKKKLHCDLISELMNEIHVDWDGYCQLLVKLEGIGLTKVEKAKSRKDVSKLFEFLENRGLISVGEYGKLLDVLKGLNEPARNLIMNYKAKIDEVSDEQDHVNIKRHASDDPEPSSSKVQKIEKVNKATSTITSRVRSKAEEWTFTQMKKQIASNIFVPTEAVKKGKDVLERNRILIYSGLPGEGKTENAFYVMNQWSNEHPESVFIKIDSLSELKDVDPTVETVIFCDDCFGKTNANMSVLNNDSKWKEIESSIAEGNVRLILTVRQHIFNRYRTKLENGGTKLFMKENVIDLSTNEFRLTDTNKIDILHKHCTSRNIEIHFYDENYQIEGQIDCEIKIDKRTAYRIVSTNCPIGFPYACYLFALHPKYTKQGAKFFKKPLQVLKERISELANSESKYIEKVQYCLLSYMMLKGESVDLTNLDVEEIFKQIIEGLSINKPSKRQRKEALEQLDDKYVVEENKLFSFKHQTILEAVALCFKDDNISLLLQYCSEDFITEFVRPMDYEDIEGEEVIKLNRNDYIYIVHRFTKRLQETDFCRDGMLYKYDGWFTWFTWWIKHPILNDEQFVDSFLHAIKDIESFKKVIPFFATQDLAFFARCKSKYLLDKLHNELQIIFHNGIDVRCLTFVKDYGNTDTMVWFLDHNLGLDEVNWVITTSPTDMLMTLTTHQNVTFNQARNGLDSIHFKKTYAKKTVFCRWVDAMFNRWPEMDQEYVLLVILKCLRFDNEEIFNTIIERRHDVATQYLIHNFFREACLKGSIRVVEFIFSKYPDTFTKKIIEESFTLACVGGHINILEYFLQLNLPNIDMTSIYLTDNDKDITNLHIAAYYGQYEVLCKLIELGLDVNSKSKTGKSVMFYAIVGYTYSDILTSHSGLEPNKSFLYWKSLYNSNRNAENIKNYDLIMKHLLQIKDFDLSELDMHLDEQGGTVGTILAFCCVKYKCEQTLELLLKRYKNRKNGGINSLKTSDKISCLHIAAFFGRIDMFKMLVKAGLSVADKDILERSVLQCAMIGFKYGFYKFYLNHNCKWSFNYDLENDWETYNMWVSSNMPYSYYIDSLESDNERFRHTEYLPYFRCNSLANAKKERDVFNMWSDPCWICYCHRRYGSKLEYSAILVDLIQHKDVNITELDMRIGSVGTLADYCFACDAQSVIKALRDVKPSVLSVEDKDGCKPVIVSKRD